MECMTAGRTIIFPLLRAALMQYAR